MVVMVQHMCQADGELGVVHHGQVCAGGAVQGHQVRPHAKAVMNPVGAIVGEIVVETVGTGLSISTFLTPCET